MLKAWDELTLAEKKRRVRRQSDTVEERSVTLGLERLRQVVDDYDAEPGQIMLRRMVRRATERCRMLKKAGRVETDRIFTQGGRHSPWHLVTQMLDADELAYIALRTMLSNDGLGKSEQQMHKTVGSRINLQIRWDQLRAEERERLKGENPEPSYNRVNMLRKRVKALNPKHALKWVKKLDDLATTEWVNDEQVKVGGQVVNAVLEALPDLFTVQNRKTKFRGKTTERRVLELTDHAHEMLDGILEEVGLSNPWLMPMLAPPRSWRTHRTGGYLKIDNPLVKPHKQQAYPYDGVPAVVLGALNAVQGTAWAINRRVLEVAEQAVAAKCDRVLPVNPEMEDLVNLPDDEWEALSKEDRQAVIIARRHTHDNNNRKRSKRAVMGRQLAVARRVSNVGSIYFPHNLDFRGRMYPLPQDLHPQADDFGKALLTFAEAKPLGQRGLVWLQYHVANTYGMDKMTREEQLEWVAENADWITTVAVDPLGVGLDFLDEAEEKWQFLAAAIELDNAWQLEDAASYECSLPISVDGSCNGLQHLSAMGRDPVGAKAVNLCPGPRQDIYQIVADKVARRVEVDAARCEDERWYDQPACKWNGKVTRKVVKRGVMTKPYGLTFAGMQEQLVKDRHKAWPDVDGDPYENANYMRDLMSVAIEDTVHASVHVMDWMQACTKALADAGLGTCWTAPTGFKVRQFYPKQVPQKYTVVGVLYKQPRQLHLAAFDKEVRLSKQVLSVAPNIVHSFDAAHMQMAVVASGLASVSAVHDSFGCHACDMDEFLDKIKDTFIMIYTPAVLNQLYVEFMAQAPEGVEIPEPPALGDFDINVVGQSDFFFA